MARYKALSDQDRAIGDRLREIRRHCEMSRSSLASCVGCDATLLKRIEEKRVTLKYELARWITNELGIDPRWLATGEGDMNGGVSLPPAEDIGEKPTNRFSDVYRAKLAILFKEVDDALPPAGEPYRQATARYQEARQRINSEYEIIDDLKLWLRAIAAPKFDEFVKRLRSQAERLAQSFPTDDAEQRLVRDAIIAQIEEEDQKRWAERDAAIEKEFEKEAQNKTLTNCSTSNIDTDVTDRWAKLKKQLQEATARKGMKTRLAKHLGVDLTRISQWLAPSDEAREPGADYTLQMLAWLNDLKHQQK